MGEVFTGHRDKGIPHSSQAPTKRHFHLIETQLCYYFLQKNPILWHSELLLTESRTLWSRRWNWTTLQFRLNMRQQHSPKPLLDQQPMKFTSFNFSIPWTMESFTCSPKVLFTLFSSTSTSLISPVSSPDKILIELPLIDSLLIANKLYSCWIIQYSNIKQQKQFV